MNNLVKSKIGKKARNLKPRNKKSVTRDTVSDNKNQTKRLLTKPERALIAEYRRHCHALFPVRKKRAA